MQTGSKPNKFQQILPTDFKKTNTTQVSQVLSVWRAQMRTQAFNAVTSRGDWDLQITNMLPLEQMTPYSSNLPSAKIKCVCVDRWVCIWELWRLQKVTQVRSTDRFSNIVKFCFDLSVNLNLVWKQRFSFPYQVSFKAMYWKAIQCFRFLRTTAI